MEVICIVILVRLLLKRYLYLVNPSGWFVAVVEECTAGHASRMLQDLLCSMFVEVIIFHLILYHYQMQPNIDLFKLFGGKLIEIWVQVLQVLPSCICIDMTLDYKG
jgi:hypothetical protein